MESTKRSKSVYRHLMCTIERYKLCLFEYVDVRSHGISLPKDGTITRDVIDTTSCLWGLTGLVLGSVYLLLKTLFPAGL